MHFGLKNRLKLISLLPISILFSITSYYVYNSYNDYKAAKQLHVRLDQNKYINEIIGNVARERGMSAMYLGDTTQNVLQSLHEQRKVVDEKITIYLEHAKKEQITDTNTKHKEKLNSNINDVLLSVAKIKSIRSLIDEKKVEFNEMFINTYTQSQIKFIQLLEKITNKEIDNEINELYSLYISMVNAKEASGIERGHISYILSRSTPLSSEDLNKWISIIGRADALNYERIQNEELVNKLNAIFQTTEQRTV
jgi:hypothetical protein